MGNRHTTTRNFGFEQIPLFKASNYKFDKLKKGSVQFETYSVDTQE
ncbi:hypothetical protein C8N25_11991 [Algoriphagus antarcticus]|uniref:Uncharacterized protein n=1 Tax=Algoriphagus antarcticus TaxID=238540 RepID=A0A3E0DKH9_9BACT|nr:hypothetical protein C8N25_11991 [Algoriphagus antarcticus]